MKKHFDRTQNPSICIIQFKHVDKNCYIVDINVICTHLIIALLTTNILINYYLCIYMHVFMLYHFMGACFYRCFSGLRMRQSIVGVKYTSQVFRENLHCFTIIVAT